MLKFNSILPSAFLMAATTLYANKVENIGYDQYLANNSQEDIPMIQTSVEHPMSRLININTAEVLESYGLAFSGSGNIYGMIKHWKKTGMEGSLILGLGDVVDIGFELSDFQTTEDINNKRSEGFIKLQAVEEDKYLPAMAFAYATSLNSSYETQSHVSYELETNKYIGVISKKAQLGNYDLGIHLAIEGLNFSLNSISDLELKNKTSFQLQPQIGLTWQKENGVMFIFENRLTNILNTEKLVDESLSFETGLQSNFAVRFYLTNWLMIDTGMSNLFNADTHENNTQIHANFSGVIPLASLGNRISSYF